MKNAESIMAAFRNVCLFEENYLFTETLSSRKQPKRLSYAVIKTTIFRVGMRSVNATVEFSCSLLRETTRVWLLQLYLPKLIGIDGLKQFGTSNFHTLVVRYFKQPYWFSSSLSRLS